MEQEISPDATNIFLENLAMRDKFCPNRRNMNRQEIESIISRVTETLHANEGAVSDKKPGAAADIKFREDASEKLPAPILTALRAGEPVLVTEDALKKLVPHGGTLLVGGRCIITPSASDFVRKKGISIREAEHWPVRACKPDVHPAAGKTIALGADHRGFALKQTIKSELTKLGFTMLDAGTGSPETCDFPDFAATVARKVASNEAFCGIVIDSAGIGSSIVANKVNGIRAAVCWDETTATQVRLHNDANVICLGADNLAPAKALAMIVKFLNTQYAPNARYDRRIAKIHELERDNN